MKKELKRKWVEALTSGKYRQGRNQLKHAGRYCCLGVLREINDPNDRRHVDETLSDVQAAEFGLSIFEIDELAEMNDIGVPFEVIAGFIQEYL